MSFLGNETWGATEEQIGRTMNSPCLPKGMIIGSKIFLEKTSLCSVGIETPAERSRRRAPWPHGYVHSALGNIVPQPHSALGNIVPQPTLVVDPLAYAELCAMKYARGQF